MPEGPYGLTDHNEKVKEIVYRADEPLTIHEIKGEMIGKLSLRKTENILDELKEEGAIENGPPETDDGLKGLVNREPTYRVPQLEQEN